MLFSDRPRTLYDNAPIHEVICQLRFPTILSINTVEPADFQDAIRDAFPQYIRKQDAPPPRITAVDGANVKVERPVPLTNYHFLSADGKWKLNLTRDFIALSTLHYENWEDFAHHLDKALAAFIQIYKPAFFQRVGLRYINLFSRAKLGLENTSWSQLIAPAYVGALCEPDLRDSDCINLGTDLLLKLDNSCKGKIHAGLAHLQSKTPGAPQDPEEKFIFDLDLSMGDQLPCTMAAGALETLHIHGGRIFEGALTDTLRSAMNPR